MADWYKEASDAIREDMIALSDSIFSHPELGYEEFKSSEEHAEVLRRYGFTVEKPYLGLETGYRAEFDSGKPGPKVCYMAEYDALPGVGHGCGHNMLGTTAVAAGIILSKKVGETSGSVVVLGTPAEETSGAKVMYAREGAFDDCDVAIVNHPCIGGHMRSGRSLALITLECVFDGKPAHAASAPEKGINALDAATITNVAIGLLRQQTREDARIHGIITEGGLAPNVIPDHVVMRFYVRAADRVYRNELLEKVKNCARAGALATDCTLQMGEFEDPYDDLMTNEALSEVMCESLGEVGVEEVLEPARSFGSLDAGNVSYVCPTIHPYFPIGTDASIANHTKEFGACTLTDFAKENMMLAAQAMAITGYRVITEPETLAKIRKEFDEMPK
jgi:amidohydrolase